MAAEKDLVIAEGGGKKKLLLIGGGGALLIVLGVVGFMFLSGGDDAAAPTAAGNEAAASAGADGAEPKGTALYVPLPRPFVFNVPGASRDRMVQIKVQLLVRGTNNETIAMRHIPLIEGSLLETFSAANADELVTVAGRDALKNKALSDLQQAMIEVVGSVVVDEVLFTGFVMQ
ncbi:flagellar basal body-associated protein FliL [Rheinheimera aquimaris]|jgi:flagellar FliL protein|uniref:flagellar basal body-associated protein FliL n=1 Tax=Rheinheimera aquimaris TaxID=412437 RepID=UPI0010666CDD|nr:flagellar basal body-associated protein FliL [Rheinheimera aquimaris]|tara:strand:+ start:561 stop:1082 length:522 start_codon:yes stop_codon:yes gene_type:complete